MDDLELQLVQKKFEIRSLPDQFKGTKEEFDKALVGLASEARSIQQKIDAAKNPAKGRSDEGESRGWEDLQKAMVEKRAITMNGAQGVNLVQDIFAANQVVSRFFNLVSKFPGPFGETRIPVMNPTLALPAASAEGAASISVDSTAVLAGKVLTLKPWYSIMGVSRGLDRGLSVDGFRAKMLPIFQKAFLSAIEKGIIIGTGSGNDALGVFVASSVGVTTSQDIACAASGAPKLADLLGLVSTLLDYNPEEALAVAICGTFLSAMFAESSSSYECIKNEILQKGTCRGVKILQTGHAPAVTTAGSYVAVGGPFSDFAWGYANGLELVPIEKSGSDLIEYNAFMYQDGRPIVGPNFRRLKTI
jgi:HK97 family phage major capsid protein